MDVDAGPTSLKVSTVAQAFLKRPTKAWWRNADLRIRTGVLLCPKLLLWARAALLSEYDRVCLIELVS